MESELFFFNIAQSYVCTIRHLKNIYKPIVLDKEISVATQSPKNSKFGSEFVRGSLTL